VSKTHHLTVPKFSVSRGLSLPEAPAGIPRSPQPCGGRRWTPHGCFVLELHRFTSRIPTRNNHDRAANENQRSRGRFPLSSANTKNHETGFGKNHRVSETMRVSCFHRWVSFKQISPVM